MRRPLERPRVPLDILLATLLGGAVIGAVAVIGGGLFDVSARDGHWPGSAWVLHTTYVQSVKRRAPAASSVPELDDDALVALGARHFDTACRQCHGAPGREQGATVRAMLPEPPHVLAAVNGWEPEHLFWILKNGVKMSGMPHWPSSVRDDGVWSVVAFLERVDGMTATEYATLLEPGGDVLDDVLGDEESGDADAGVDPGGASARTVDETRSTDATLAACARCHGVDGLSAGNTHVPRLDLLDEAYLLASLAAYRDGMRHSGIMRHATATLSDADIARLATHYARRFGSEREPVRPRRDHLSLDDDDDDDARAARLARGRALATGAVTRAARRDAPVCAACHGPWPVPLSARYPALAGQHEGFLLAQLRAWKADTRGGTELARLMHEVVPALEDDDMRALATYYAAASTRPTARDPGARRRTP